MMRGVGLLLLLAAPAWAGTALAVLPFKNLNADANIDWLKLGIAETMVADLKKAGHTMVERDQVDKALAELALQGQKLDDDSRAARAGKLMGATTVVVGGYQKAGEQLRITARFVSVESGVVERTAKVTGKMTEVFDLQDQIVSELVKLRPPAGGAPRGRTAPVRRPGTEKTLAAYKSYSQALSSSSQAERVEKLQEALELDPEFTYAADDLKALKDRLNIYEAKATKASDEQGRKLFAQINDPNLSVQERNLKVVMYLGSLTGKFRWATALEDGQKIYAMKLPPAENINAREQASMYIFLAAKMLKKNDLALQAGERHLKEFSEGQMAGSVQMQMRMLVEEIQRNEETRKKAQAELAEFERELKPPRNDFDVILRGFRRCTIPCNGLLFEQADKACLPFLDQHKGQDDKNHFAPLAGYLYAVSLSNRGDFDKARAMYLSLQKDYPEWAKTMPIDTLVSTLPKP